MHDLITSLHAELRALLERLSSSLAFEHEYRDDLATFGQPTEDAEREHQRTQRHLEAFLLERPSDVVGAVPLERFFDGVDDDTGAALAQLYASLRASLVGVFLVKVVDEHDGVLLEDLLGRGQYVLAEAELAPLMEPGDLLVGRLFPQSIDTDGARTTWVASPAAMHLRHGALLDALLRDLEVMRERARGPLRMSQRDLEVMFFSPGIEVSEERRTKPAVDLPTLRKRARDLMIDAGLPDERVDAYLDALGEHELPKTDLALGGDDPLGWVLEELAFESDIELDHARRVLAAYWHAATTAGAVGESSAPAADVPEANDAETRAKEALARFDAGRAEGRDLEDLFAELEADLGVDSSDGPPADPLGDPVADPVAQPGDDGFVGDFPGAMGALVQEFLWDAARLAQVKLDTFARQHRDLELFAQFGAFLVNADELGAKHVEVFLARWIWEADRLERGDYSGLGAVRATRAFCTWMSEHQDLELSADTAAFMDAVDRDADRIDALNRAADAEGATAGATKGFFEYVGHEDGETRWLDQQGGTFAGEVAGVEQLDELRSGDWVEAWRDDGRLGVITVYPPVAGPYLKATS